MPTSTGDAGPYEIIGRLGEGGMGVVYRARDTRLGREVALKVLPLSVSIDPDRRVRFEREAQALAALNHPRIAAIHDVLEAEGVHAIVMELVAGRTLADRIAQGPLLCRDVISIGIDISEALAAAHAGAIVHRDLKPANIVITDGGNAKVLDFGIAKLVGEDDTSPEATSTALTGRHGVIGTAGYMSPEQAHGHSVDARSDIFSLGTVLYEALSGHRAFRGDTTAATVAAVLRDDPPPLRSIVPTTPRAVERCVMRCLEKEPRRRYQNALDLKVALEDAREDLTTSGTRAVDPTSKPARGRRARRWLGWGATGLVLATAGFIAADVSRAPIVFTPFYRPFITEVTSASNPAWSPDGKTLAYLDVINGQPEVFVRGADASQSTGVAKDAASSSMLLWAPDGSRLYFMRGDGSIASVGAGGGEAQRVEGVAKAGAADGYMGRAAFTPDGRSLVFSRGLAGAVQLSTLDTGTSAARPLTPTGLPATLAIVQAMAFSPDGRTLALLASTTAANQSRGIWLISWPDGAARHVLADAPYVAWGFSFAWMPDSRRIVMSGSPVHGGSARLLVVDTVTATLTPLTAGKESEGNPAVSPDGSRIAFVSQRSGQDLIQLPLDGGPPEPLVATSRTETNPDVSASGLLAYVTDADGAPVVRLRSATDTWSRPLTGSSDREDDRVARPGEVRLSRDGQRAAVGTSGAEHLIWIYATAGGSPVRLDQASTDQHGPSWSPDGNWIAYRRLLNGTWSIVKAPLGGGAIVRLDEATPGGGTTDWSPTGAWIAHSRPDGMHLVSARGRKRARPCRTALRSVSLFARRFAALRHQARGRPTVGTRDVGCGRWTRVARGRSATRGDRRNPRYSSDP